MTTKPRVRSSPQRLLQAQTKLDPGFQPESGARGEGLRERKKKQTRQLISDMATQMFLKDGFDAVRVADVAEACSVSTKTVYNYFPTKESLILDRFESMETDVRRVFGVDLSNSSPVEAAVQAIVAELLGRFEHWGNSGHSPEPKQIRRFAEMIQQTPALRAAQWEMLDRMCQVAAEGIALRIGVGPDEPEPQMAASAILDLWRIQFRSMMRHATGSRSAAEICDAVIADVRRAAQLLDTGLYSYWRFLSVTEGDNSSAARNRKKSPQ